MKYKTETFLACIVFAIAAIVQWNFFGNVSTNFSMPFAFALSGGAATLFGIFLGMNIFPEHS